MKNQSFVLAVTMMGCALQASAESVQTFRANITGGGGDSGKCTIEVEVDDTAEVEVYGAEGRIRTLSGGPSIWRRFQCTSPLPRNPVDFRFRGIDGRGRVELIRDPRNGGGRAVIRIEDPKGGREGYTFDLEWRGGGGYPGGGGGNHYPVAEAMNVCKNAVRERARQDYGVKDVEFTNINRDDNAGRNDSIVGTFDGRSGRNRDRYSFSCSVNFSNGNIRSVDVRPR